jgi:hypothetical protein
MGSAAPARRHGVHDDAIGGVPLPMQVGCSTPTTLRRPLYGWPTVLDTVHHAGRATTMSAMREWIRNSERALYAACEGVRPADRSGGRVHCLCPRAVGGHRQSSRGVHRSCWADHLGERAVEDKFRWDGPVVRAAVEALVAEANRRPCSRSPTVRRWASDLVAGCDRPVAAAAPGPRIQPSAVARCLLRCCTRFRRY